MGGVRPLFDPIMCDPLRKPLPPLRHCSIASIVTTRCAHGGRGQHQQKDEDEQKFTKSLLL